MDDEDILKIMNSYIEERLIKPEVMSKIYTDAWLASTKDEKYEKNWGGQNDNEAGYIEQIKLDIDEGISEVNTNGLYYAKKGIRKVLKMVTKQIRFSGIKETELIVLLYFCKQVLDMEIRMSESRVLVNLLNTQFKKVLKAKSTLHEDLQFDYKNEIDEVMDRLSRLEARSLSYGY
jgi:hypothetical protein